MLAGLSATGLFAAGRARAQALPDAGADRKTSGDENLDAKDSPELDAAPDPALGENLDYDRSRLEPAAFPVIGGDSDVGVELGAIATFAKFGHGVRPYEWNMDVLAAVSFKSGPSGNPEITQQNYLWQVDVPGLRGGTLRLNPALSYTSTINAGYFSLGNASSADRPATVAGESGRYFQYEDRAVMVRELTRMRWRPPFDLMLGATYRYENPSAYAGSKLAEDAAAGRVRGLRPMSLFTLGGGVLYDSRDNEFFPHDGSYHQLGIRLVQGIPGSDEVRYGAFSSVFAIYRHIHGPFLLAARVVVDAEFGNVPFYDLFTGEPFLQDQIIGGSAGIRGVPEGRYLGRLKVLGNIELRALLFDLRWLGQSFQFGGDLLFDTGRTWIDYTFTAPEDGRGIGLKWGAGGGIYVRWGQATVLRIEAAYSPDAVAENPSLPVGIYFQDGVMF
ncbi:MAG TPA: BamA/TamA family outer membrane protein [Polyangiaceae bacterium]|nr:BamA/TamA family outer membrane protein [Polyangiaceae bacterium]